MGHPVHVILNRNPLFSIHVFVDLLSFGFWVYHTLEKMSTRVFVQPPIFISVTRKRGRGTSQLALAINQGIIVAKRVENLSSKMSKIRFSSCCIIFLIWQIALVEVSKHFAFVSPNEFLDFLLQFPQVSSCLSQLNQLNIYELKGVWPLCVS